MDLFLTYHVLNEGFGITNASNNFIINIESNKINFETKLHSMLNVKFFEYLLVIYYVTELYYDL